MYIHIISYHIMSYILYDLSVFIIYVLYVHINQNWHSPFDRLQLHHFLIPGIPAIQNFNCSCSLAEAAALQQRKARKKQTLGVTLQ